MEIKLGYFKNDDNKTFIKNKMNDELDNDELDNDELNNDLDNFDEI